MSVTSAILQLRHELPSTVQLVAVSKFKPISDILEAYAAGQRAFGENRPQELAAKAQLANQLKYSLIIVSCGPILLAYPFVQKYFVKGVMIGSLKG